MRLTIIFLFLFLGKLISQDVWKKQNNRPNYEVGTVYIDKNKNYYVNLKHNNYIYKSTNFGITWNNIWNLKTPLESIPYRDFIHFKNKVVINDCKPPCTQYLVDDNGKLQVYRSSRDLLLNKVVFNNHEQLFFIEYDGIYGSDSLWNIDSNNLVYPCSFCYIVFMYDLENNFVIIKDINSIPVIVKVYKFNSHTKKTELYSVFNGDPVKSEIIVTPQGNIIYRDYKNGEYKYYYSNSSNPNAFMETQFSQDEIIQNSYYLGMNDDGQIFVLTDDGVFMNYGEDLNNWIKCKAMSNAFPFPISKDLTNDMNFYFLDSLHAIVNFGNDCGQSNTYLFSDKGMNWKSVDIDARFENLINLQVDKNSQLFGVRPCDSYDNREFQISKNGGISFDKLEISTYPVNALIINKEGDAVAVAFSKELFIYNSSTNSWDNIITSIPNKLYLDNLYKVGDYLLLESHDPTSSPVKVLLYSSSDGGRSWEEIKSPINPFILTELSYYIYSNNSGYWIVTDHDRVAKLNDKVLISKDKGRTWSIDSTFKDFSGVKSIVQLPDGRYVFTGWNPDPLFNVRGIYILEDKDNYDILTTELNKNYFGPIKHNGNNLFGYTRTANNSFPFTLNFDGSNLVKYESGLGPVGYDNRIIMSTAFDKNGKIYVSLAYDGIYTNNTNVYNSIHEAKIIKEKQFYLTLNYSKNYLLVSNNDGSEFSKSLNYSVINSLGQILLQGNLYNSSGIIKIDNLSPGTYFFLVNEGIRYLEKLPFSKY